jgi:hypothetical protein
MRPQYLYSLPVIPATPVQMRIRGKGLPAGWFESWDRHQQYWDKAGPALQEIKRLKARFGRSGPHGDPMQPGLPGHIATSIRNYEAMIDRIHKHVFGDTIHVKNLVRIQPITPTSYASQKKAA